MNRTTESIETAIGAYFAACDATRERIPLKNGGFEERQIPYTLFGLARAVQMTPDALLERMKHAERSRTGQLPRDAVLKVAAYTMERALLGELTYQMALETIRSMGLLESGDGGVTAVVMDERLLRFAK